MTGFVKRKFIPLVLDIMSPNGDSLTYITEEKVIQWKM
jgi:hypothetical protein